MEIVIYGFAGVGILLLLRPVATALKGSVNVQAVNAQLVKLVQAGNTERALKLCAAAPAAAYLAIADRMLRAAGEGSGPARAERALASFRDAAAEVQARRRLPLALAVAAGSTGVVAVLMAIVLGAAPDMMPLFVIAGLDVLVAIWAARSLSTRGFSRAAHALAAALRSAA